MEVRFRPAILSAQPLRGVSTKTVARLPISQRACNTNPNGMKSRQAGVGAVEVAATAGAGEGDPEGKPGAPAVTRAMRGIVGARGGDGIEAAAAAEAAVEATVEAEAEAEERLSSNAPVTGQMSLLPRARHRQILAVTLPHQELTKPGASAKRRMMKSRTRHLPEGSEKTKTRSHPPRDEGSARAPLHVRVHKWMRKPTQMIALMPDRARMMTRSRVCQHSTIVCSNPSLIKTGRSQVRPIAFQPCLLSC